MTDFASIFALANHPTVALKDYGEIVAESNQIKQMQQQNQIGALNLQQQQQSVKDSMELRDTIKNAIGNVPPEILQSDASAGTRAAVQAASRLDTQVAQKWVEGAIAFQKNATSLTQDQLNIAKQKTALAGGDVISAPTPEAAFQATQYHLKQGNLTPQQAQGLLADLPSRGANTDAFNMWKQIHGANLGATQALLDTVKPTVKIEGGVIAKLSPQGEVLSATPIPGMATTEIGKELQQYRQDSGNKAATTLDPGFQAWHNKMHPNMATIMVGSGSDMSPEALDRAADKYHTTGQLDNYGFGPTGTKIKTAVMNKEAEKYGADSTSLASAKATYNADQGSLATLQKNRDAVISFENTAGKNLDMFLNLASKIPDYGAPWINTPLRLVNMNALGSADQAAANAARQVANNEIAKVTTNPNLGGQLSDDARHEIESYNPQNATFAQAVSVAKVLKQDMSNRHQSLDSSLNEIKARISLVTNSPSTHTKGAKSADELLKALGH